MASDGRLLRKKAGVFMSLLRTVEEEEMRPFPVFSEFCTFWPKNGQNDFWAVFHFVFSKIRFGKWERERIFIVLKN